MPNSFLNAILMAEDKKSLRGSRKRLTRKRSKDTFTLTVEFIVIT